MMKFILIISMLFAFTCTQASLIALYEFEEPEPSDAPGAVIDRVAGNNGSTVMGAGVTQGVAGKFGNAYQFTAGGVDLGSDPAVQPTDGFTITMWINSTTLRAFDRYLESQSTNANGQHGIRLDSGASGDRFRALIRSGNAGGNTQHTHSTTLMANAWYFAATRYNSASSGLQLTVLADAGSTTAGAVAGATQTAAVLNTGALNTPHARSTLLGLEVPTGNTNNMRGFMDDVAFFDHVLTDQELADTFNNGAAFFLIPEPSSATLLLLGFTLLTRARMRVQV